MDWEFPIRGKDLRLDRRFYNEEGVRWVIRPGGVAEAIFWAQPYPFMLVVRARDDESPSDAEGRLATWVRANIEANILRREGEFWTCDPKELIPLEDALR